MSDGSTPVIVFPGGEGTTGISILWTKSSNIVAPNVCYDFTPTDGDTIPSHYTNTGTGYEYSYVPPIPPVVPNPTAFLAACVADTNIQPLFYLLAPYYAAIENYAVNPTAVQLLWSQLITQYSSLLTSEIQTLIEGYAVTYNMPLTS